MKKQGFLWLVALMMTISFCAAAQASVIPDAVDAAVVAMGNLEERAAGERDYVCFPVLEHAGEHTDAINAQIQQKANLSAYQNVMTFGTGSTGLRVDYEAVLQGDILSLVIIADGKMPVGRPSQVYYPMTIDVQTGEEIAFETLFHDAHGAIQYIEQVLENEMEERLSTHLENRSLFPVPYDRFMLDEKGGLTFFYERDQLSFLSGFSGAVYFRHSELMPYYDLTEGSVLNRIMEKETEDGFMAGLGERNCIGLPLDDVLKKYRSTVDSEYYPGGALYEVEDARLQGTFLLTDESEEKVTGLLSSRLDDGGIVTGKTTLTEAIQLLGDGYVEMPMDENTAEAYRVCPGRSVVYTEKKDNQNGSTKQSYTLYADEQDIVQYLKLMIEE